MNYFKISDKINQNKELSLQEKALLNQALSYQLNNKEFFATNEYLADYWNTSVSTIKRALAVLESFQLIQRRKERKQHEVGDQSWYNKRYITIELKQLFTFLSIVMTETKEVEAIVELAPIDSLAVGEELPTVAETALELTPEKGCYFGGNYPNEENEFSKFFGNQMEQSELQRILNHARSLSDTPKKGMAEWLLKNHQDWDESKIRGVYEVLLEKEAA